MQVLTFNDPFEHIGNTFDNAYQGVSYAFEDSWNSKKAFRISPRIKQPRCSYLQNTMRLCNVYLPGPFNESIDKRTHPILIPSP